MAQTKLKITYQNGDEVEVLATPRAQVETERFLRQQGGLGEATVVEASFRLGWESLRSRKLLPQAAGGDMGYEEWLNEIVDAEEMEPEKVDPTPPAQSPTSSPD